MRVAVIGGSTVTDREYEQARDVGRLLGERGHEVVCGGLGGVMEAVCAGARETGGHTIGILPNEDRKSANDYVETAIATGMGNARNVLVVMNGDAVIAVDGSTGTLSELGHALDMDRPLAGIGAHSLEGIEHVETAEAAVDYVESASAVQ
ncbi:TIGR00725 family protein [Haloarcula salinisoli]|uniref:TIGR00725 family protein n=1 Tax=Haloarcula salinisoli TaxID=2487746 RepID=A0A8J7YE14_9EURY|nr:TIGR00725 family protein [Halomicroarcula salinisoli]MBX0286873.1 TIGR00725 family protein [Halomicroarcula salinisoli]MBX0304175.1 TIGR00725 family protein [Halomicroarcula salinisoli]